MALDKRAWRCQKGHGAQEKGHGAAPCYFALDLTLKREPCRVRMRRIMTEAVLISDQC